MTIQKKNIEFRLEVGINFEDGNSLIAITAPSKMFQPYEHSIIMGMTCDLPPENDTGNNIAKRGEIDSQERFSPGKTVDKLVKLLYDFTLQSVGTAQKATQVLFQV